MGLKVTKIRTIYRFKQPLWLEQHNNHNTQKRTEAKTNFEKDLYKLMNNAFFGETMENVREIVNLQIIPHTNTDQIIKRQSKLSFKGIKFIIMIFAYINMIKKRQSLINQFTWDLVF